MPKVARLNPAPQQQPALAMRPMWTLYDVRWEFLTRVCGQTPGDPEMIKRWLEVRQPAVRPAGARSIDEINAEVLETLAAAPVEPDDTQYQVLVFQKHDGVCCFRHGTVKSHMKDCARVISSNFVGKIEGEKTFAVRVVNCVYTDAEMAYFIPLVRPDGTPITAPDGEHEKAARAWVGGRMVSFLKKIQYIDPPCVMQFRLKVMSSYQGKQDAVPESDLHYLFQYGGTHGYAGERGDGEGRYFYTITRVDSPGGRPNVA